MTYYLKVIGLLILSLISVSSFTYSFSSPIISENRNKTKLMTEKISSMNVMIDDIIYPRLGFISPIFTDTAYSDGGFYDYYTQPSLNPQLYLSLPLIDSISASQFSYSFKNALINKGYPSTRISVLSDIDLHNNLLYDSNGSRLYDVLVFFHNEYVSLPEYNNMLQFIATGGNVIIANGNAFYAMVDYNSSTNYLTLLSGHGYEFDGNSTNTFSRFGFYGFFSNNYNLKYIGSDDCNYHNGNFTSGKFHLDSLNPHPVSLDMIEKGYTKIALNYKSLEENCLLTKNAQAIVDWGLPHVYGRDFMMYETFPYGPLAGSLINFEIYGSSIILNDEPLLLTFIDLVRHQMGYFKTPWIRYPVPGGVYNDQNLIIDFTDGLNTLIYLNGTFLGTLPAKSSLGFLQEGVYNLTVVFNIDNLNITRTSVFSIDRTPPQIIFNGNNYSVSNYPKIPLTINVKDKNPEDYSLITYDSKYISSNQTLPNLISGHIRNDEHTLERNLSLNLSNGTNFISIKAFDSAGNENQTSITFTINSSSGNIFSFPETKITQINNTVVKISLLPFNMNMTPYLMLSNVITSKIKLNDWVKLNFTNLEHITNENYLYYTKSNKDNSFIYKLFITNNTITKYIPNLKYFYWNNNKITVNLCNLQNILSNTKPITVIITNDYRIYTNVSISLVNEKGGSQILTKFTGNVVNYTVNLILDELLEGHNILQIIFYSNKNLMFTFPLIINKSSILYSSTFLTMTSGKNSPSFIFTSFLAFPLMVFLRKRKNF